MMWPWQLAFWRRRRAEQPPTWNEAGVSPADGGLLPWPAVERVFVYKKDCYTVDQMRVVVAGQGVMLEFCEKDEDFTAFCACVTRQLALEKDLYLLLLAVPTFDQTLVEVYAKF